MYYFVHFWHPWKSVKGAQEEQSEWHFLDLFALESVLPNVQTDILLTVFPNPYFLADPITTCVLIEANEIRQNANNLIRSGHHQLIIKSNRRRKQRFHYRSRKEELLCSFAMVCCWPGCRGACGLRWEKENQAQRFGKMSILLKDVSIDSQLSELFCNREVVLQCENLLDF
jgi:hypothetical protein